MAAAEPGSDLSGAAPASGAPAAAVPDSGRVEGAAAGPRTGRFTLVGVVALLLALALAGVALVQVRQTAMLREALVEQDDYVALSLYQIEIEYLRLREQWVRSLAQGEDLDREALQLRYDIWVSRVDLLRNERAARLMVGNHDYEDTLGAMLAFIARADRLLGPQAQAQVPDAARLRALEPDLLALGQPIHTLSISAAHHVSNQMAERNAAVHQHNRIGMLLTLFLSALVLVFGVLAMRQLRLLDQRRRALVELTDHLRDARRQAEAASEAKSVFLANMSHEIRTPFHGLLGMLSLLRETGLNARQIGYLRTATESADHLLTVLNDVLDMSLLESGRLTLVEEPVDLREVLREVEALMRPQAQLKSLALHVGADPGVPERARADRTRLKQILFNLLSNAVKFSDRGKVVLELHRTRGTDGAGELEFVVTDTGIGMDAATLDRLFQRFVQGDESRARRHGGTGLGLEISRSLARLMGGDITVHSAVGEGSRFVLRLPLDALSAATPAEPAAAPGEPACAAVPAEPALRVLVAEDHPVNRQYMAALLEGMRHEAVFAANGVEAVQALQGQRFDLVLMDLHMPLLDGVGATLAIRALPDSVAATVPIIALTADAFAQTRERCLMAGMNDFLAKPVSPDKLAATLRRLFGPGAGGAGSAAGADGAQAPAAPPGAAAAAAPEPAPLIDAAAIEAVLRAMPRARLQQMLQAFFDDGPAIVQQLRDALREGQALDLRVSAHAVRGAALNFGLVRLAQTAQALHEGAPHLPAHEVARMIQRFEDQLGDSRRACEGAGLLDAATA
ncbi:MAG TPA: ATP-binding protein [Rubrivivax sp.]|nr:ATP-binding protein [Rubrivivax sp.]